MHATAHVRNSRDGYEVLVATDEASRATPERIAALIRGTDAIAEIRNTVRKGVPLTLRTWPPA